MNSQKVYYKRDLKEMYGKFEVEENMEMDSRKYNYYKHKEEVETNQKTEVKQFKNKIGKEKRKKWWN